MWFEPTLDRNRARGRTGQGFYFVAVHVMVTWSGRPRDAGSIPARFFFASAAWRGELPTAVGLSSGEQCIRDA